ncbi:uncharacterized protein PHACADRAFT_207672 [Phanerochaete carnosa HHB-10118-sp]|uniref:hydroxymethylglutaryl-CoA reductase (NADPH) n=1 Tax=Phanerochaete carnosa (strain HHB-10118-sp) TaxID=650164 RepID=K5WBT3_PHACS|nr:uncharacterized protein PHACADRAFT_207672 [Phanerochaete carnosa HHB-10118-sp]EKM56434.1 hypothetical protein PHACADRAFT_207672 [Phanerochaete carnosa HHB-10118-sp]
MAVTVPLRPSSPYTSLTLARHTPGAPATALARRHKHTPRINGDRSVPPPPRVDFTSPQATTVLSALAELEATAVVNDASVYVKIAPPIHVRAIPAVTEAHSIASAFNVLSGSTCADAGTTNTGEIIKFHVRLVHPARAEHARNEPTRPLDEITSIFEDGPRPALTSLSLLTDEGAILLVHNGKIAAYGLEKMLGDSDRVVTIRRALISRASETKTLEQSDVSTSKCTLSAAEGTLVVSTSHGRKALNPSEDVTTIVTYDGLIREPAIDFPNNVQAAAARGSIENPEGHAIFEEAFESNLPLRQAPERQVCNGRSHAARSVRPPALATMGMNTISKATEKALEVLGKEFPETTVKVHPEHHELGQQHDGCSVGRLNAHAVNNLTAIFLATGQDPAQNVESSSCMMLVEPTNNGEDLVITISMLCIGVGTVGGGTVLAPQQAVLEIGVLTKRHGTLARAPNSSNSNQTTADYLQDGDFLLSNPGLAILLQPLSAFPQKENRFGSLSAVFQAKFRLVRNRLVADHCAPINTQPSLLLSSYHQCHDLMDVSLYKDVVTSRGLMYHYYFSLAQFSIQAGLTDKDYGVLPLDMLGYGGTDKPTDPAAHVPNLNSSYLSSPEPHANEAIQTHVDSFVGVMFPHIARSGRSACRRRARSNRAYSKTSLRLDHLTCPRQTRSGFAAPTCWFKIATSELSAEDDEQIPPGRKFPLFRAPIYYAAAKNDYVSPPETGQEVLSGHSVTRTEYNADHWLILSHADEIARDPEE